MKLSSLLIFSCIFYSNLALEAKPFVVCDIHSQLGNQFFEVAAAVSLALDHDAEALFPDFMAHQRDNVDNIGLNYKKIFNGLNVSQPSSSIEFFYQEPYLSYAPIPYHSNMRIRGYFQSEKYFYHHKEEILPLFAPSKEIVDYLERRYSDIIHHPNTVAIHVRTGHSHKTYPLNGREYVEKALALFPEDSQFIVFSDNIKYCQNHLRGLRPKMRFIQEKKHYYAFYLMSMCKHQIISNSTFSWWAAYLNKNPEKIVVAPSKWFLPDSGLYNADIIPEGWIVID